MAAMTAQTVDHPPIRNGRCRREIASSYLVGQTGLGTNRSTAMMCLDEVVVREPDILGGTPVFHGTRVPIRSLFDYLEGGETLDEFLRQFPSVRRAQAVALLELACQSVLADARAA
jgi:uncharacterized protein (DUF433 family)